MPAIGEVWKDDCFLLKDGVPVAKYVVVLGADHSYITPRRLTTKAQGRPAVIGCHLGGFRPGHFIGVPGIGPLLRETWVDLGPLDDIDTFDFDRGVKHGRYTKIGEVPRQHLCDLLMCAIHSPDTTPRQERRFYAARTFLGCK